MKLVFSWDKVDRLGRSLFSGWTVSEMLVELLQKKSEDKCEQCGVGDCVHEAARAFLLLRKTYGLHWSWDNEAKRRSSIHGWSMEELLSQLLNEVADIKDCHCKRRCLHKAARQALATKKLAEPEAPTA